MTTIIQWLGFTCWIVGAALQLTHTRFYFWRTLGFVFWAAVVLMFGFLVTVSGSGVLHLLFTLAGAYRLYRVKHLLFRRIQSWINV